MWATYGGGGGGKGGSPLSPACPVVRSVVQFRRLDWRAEAVAAWTDWLLGRSVGLEKNATVRLTEREERDLCMREERGKGGREGKGVRERRERRSERL